MAKRTKITIEIDSLFILRARRSTRAWCPVCAAEGEVIASEGTGSISNLDSPELRECLNSAELHRVQAADGSILVCVNSLLACVRNKKPLKEML